MFDISSIVIFGIGYIFGAISAYLVMRKERVDKFAPKQLERLFILTTVTAIWTVSNIVAIFNDTYNSPNALHALFGAVVGFYFDIAIFTKLNPFNKK